MRFLCLLLPPLIALQPIWAQTSAASASDLDFQTPIELKVVKDPGPALPSSIAKEGLTISATDADGGPIPGVAVALGLPEDEPTGRFADGLRAWVVYTDGAGLAAFPAIHWHERQGVAEVRVTGAKGRSHAGLLIQQRIEPAAAPKSAVAPPPTISVEPKRASGSKPALADVPKVVIQTSAADAVSIPLADVVPITAATTGAAVPTGGLHPLSPKSVPVNDQPKPAVSVTNSGAGSGRVNKKWIILGAVAAGVGVGAMMAMKGHGSSTTSGGATTGISIGTPTISVSH